MLQITRESSEEKYKPKNLWKTNTYKINQSAGMGFRGKKRPQERFKTKTKILQTQEVKWLQLWGPVLFSLWSPGFEKGSQWSDLGCCPKHTQLNWWYLGPTSREGHFSAAAFSLLYPLTTLSKEGGNHPFVPKAILWQLSGRQQLQWVPVVLGTVINSWGPGYLESN